MAVPDDQSAEHSPTEKPTGTLERGLAILDLLGTTGPIGAGHIAEALGLSRSATYRILGTLRESGYVEWDESDRITLGFRTIQLGFTALNSLDPVALAYAHLRDLAATVEESALLAIPDGHEMVYLAHEEARGHSITMRPLLGSRRRLHCTSLGKAYLAALPIDEADALVDRMELPAITPNTISDPTRLRRELDEVRVRGYAIDDVENEPGVVCFGAAVRDHRGRPICAISVAGPEERMRAKQDIAVSLIVEHAFAISRRLGYAGPAAGVGSPRR
ncbi:IclR family transcriptional regulator [Actinoallomurus acanthiterrae]